ncbi:uncharacterized protein [Cicer arietinum]|uniref:Uncharacterized protein LOC101502123 isoform X4 n=1 Tax=Cicer arietinum TaxID=3827 RepID=A0A1S3E2L7_CICAR|nr:uncharacterized protein LOC101502123 isoform X4 [Cicer arietinum]
MYIEENRYKNFVKLQRKPMMSFGVGLSMNCNCCFRMPPSSYLLSHVSSVSPFSYSCCWSSFNSNNLNLTRRASSEGLPNELVEDSKFVPMNAEDASYGPPALLLLGFEANEHLKIQQFLKELEGEFLKIDKSLPRICFFSGLNGEEMMMFIDAFPETGLKPAAFAALVPNSADKPLYELIEEITGDHEMLTGEQL